MSARHRAAPIARLALDVALVALVVAVLVAVAVAKLPELAGARTFVVAGGSMEPAIGPGAAVVVAPVDARRIEVGDVVSLRVEPADTLFTHRVARVVDVDGRLSFETKGDANPGSDPTLVPEDWIVGRVGAIVPMVGYLIALLSIPSGTLFVIGLGATVLILAWLVEGLESRVAGSDVSQVVGPPDTGPALPPSAQRADRPIQAMVARAGGVRRMVPDARRGARWRAIRATKQGRVD